MAIRTNKQNNRSQEPRSDRYYTLILGNNPIYIQNNFLCPLISFFQFHFGGFPPSIFFSFIIRIIEFQCTRIFSPDMTVEYFQKKKIKKHTSTISLVTIAFVEIQNIEWSRYCGKYFLIIHYRHIETRITFCKKSNNRQQYGWIKSMPNKLNIFLSSRLKIDSFHKSSKKAIKFVFFCCFFFSLFFFFFFF